jgi:hypothetical protein
MDFKGPVRHALTSEVWCNALYVIRVEYKTVGVYDIYAIVESSSLNDVLCGLLFCLFK